MKLGSGFDVQAFLIRRTNPDGTPVSDLEDYDALPREYKNALNVEAASYNFNATELRRHLEKDPVWGHITAAHVAHIVRDLDRQIAAAVRKDTEKFLKEFKDKMNAKKARGLRGERTAETGSERF